MEIDRFWIVFWLLMFILDNCDILNTSMATVILQKSIKKKKKSYEDDAAS